ncbi:MAG TPA: hypothetical protein VFS21_09255 [Roseiflexaceae bacterium]|nr:hypothetical protein [Roseiflexaceae bacterium]
MFDNIRSRFFPHALHNSVSVVSVDHETFWRAVETIPPEEGPFAPSASLGHYAPPEGQAAQSTLLRQAARANHEEYLLLLDECKRCVGWSYGRMRDVRTFLMAHSAVVRPRQREGLYTALLGVLLPYLRVLGYERVTSNHMVTNRAVLIAKLKAGFIISGMALDERFGAQVSMTYFFDEERRQGFAHAYSVEHYPDTPEYHEDETGRPGRH